MKLCVNYLMELRELIPEGKIDYIDYIKLYSIDGDLSPFDWCCSQREVMFHGYIGHGSNIADADFLERRDNDEQREYYKRANTPYVSTHINRSFEDPATEEEITERIKKNIQVLKDEFGMRVILENVPYHPNKAYNRFMVMPEYIKKSVNDNDCGFLFDIGHARAAAERLGIPFNEYVSRLPMDKLVEVHLAGSMRTKDGGIAPNHSKMHEEDYEFLEWAIQNCPTLETITLEYGPIDQTETIDETPYASADKIQPKIKEEIVEQLERIHAIMKKYNLK
ncbi:MAG: DUF692 family protein [Clostridia bacterium]|nr:DUF692 family protein [Clostridia bacterium]